MRCVGPEVSEVMSEVISECENRTKKKGVACCCSLQAVVYHLKGLMRGREPGCANKAAPQTRHRNWFLKQSSLALLFSSQIEWERGRNRWPHRDRYSSSTEAEQVRRAPQQEVCCSAEWDVIDSDWIPIPTFAATRVLNHSPIVGIVLGAHFCAFARFFKGLQTFSPPQIVSQVAWVTQRPHLNRLCTKGSLWKPIEILEGDESLLSGRRLSQTLLTSVVSGKWMNRALLGKKSNTSPAVSVSQPGQKWLH